MRVGVTGGTGFLGRHLVWGLLDRGDEVTVFTRNPGRKLPGGVRAVRWDPNRDPAPADALSALDAVVHLAGESVVGLWSEGKKHRIRESRVVGTRHLVEGWQAAETAPRILISGSAVGVYGDRGDEEITEDTPAGSGFLAEVAVDWEAAAIAARTSGTRVVLLRTPLPLHPSGGALRAMLTPFKLGLGAVLGSGRQWMPWIHLDDWVRATLFALDTEAVQGPFNPTSPEPVTNREYTRTLARVLRRPAFLPAPAFALRLLMREAADEMLLVSQRALPRRAEEHGFTFGYPKLEPALRDLLGR
jgi:uncharacterized protein (TIGR01777 family)